MSRTFRRYALDEYVQQVLKPMVDQVQFPELHIHGTWKPTIAMFRQKPGDYYMQVMYRHHTFTNGWSDIAQHATVDPDGYIWDGRPLLKPPASATGHNDADDDGIHPFMFEMIGNFDVGQEKLEGPQLRTSAGLSYHVMDLFGSVPRLHREFTNQKTCPGSGITKDWFLMQIAAYEEEVKPRMSKEDAGKIIGFLRAAYWAVENPEARAEFNRLANEVRKTAGMALQ